MKNNQIAMNEGRKAPTFLLVPESGPNLAVPQVNPALFPPGGAALRWLPQPEHLKE